MTSTISTAPPRALRASTTLAVACAAPLLALMNFTVPMVTLPETARALGAGPTGPAWILNAVALGRDGAGRGHRRSERRAARR